MSGHLGAKLVVVKCVFCGSEFFVHSDRTKPKMYCTLQCIELESELGEAMKNYHGNTALRG